MRLKTTRGMTKAVAIAFGLSQLGLPCLMGQDKVMPSAQSGAVASASQESGTTTVMVPQDQVTYQTVYDVEYVQIPTTQLQTQYRTEYRSQTVPVTRVVTEQVPTTQTSDPVQDRIPDPDGTSDADGRRTSFPRRRCRPSTRPSTGPRRTGDADSRGASSHDADADPIQDGI